MSWAPAGTGRRFIATTVAVFAMVTATVAVRIGPGARAAAPEAASPATSIDHYGRGKPRMIILTDIGNEPDDQMSLVRALVYSNDIDIEAIVSTTSTHKKSLDEESSSIVDGVLGAYGEVRPNLLEHDKSFPSVKYLRSVSVLGQQDYGRAGMGRGKMTEGARRIIAAADKPDPRPLWVTVWGGANTLGQALYHVRKTRTRDELGAFVRKLRVYSISDQDDSGPWARKEFPDLQWVVTPAVAPDTLEGFIVGWACLERRTCGYGKATWTGISGEHFYRLAWASRGPSTVLQGPDSTLVTHAWLRQNIQSKGPLGAAYPTYTYIMEGDTPSFFGLIPNGLASYSNPTWGGWGGRYVYRTPTGGPTVETRPIFTQGKGSSDTVVGFDHLTHTDDFATIYRWRQAYQYDFANRMDWTIKDYADANHAPSVSVNGVGGHAPLFISARPGTEITLSAAGTDPDGDQLTYTWFHYAEAGTSTGPLADVTLSGTTGQRITVTPQSVGQAHVILTVTDDGKGFPMTSYRRVVLDVTNEDG